jgi:hypothetical protein
MAFEGRLQTFKQTLKAAERNSTSGDVSILVSKYDFVPRKAA